MNMKLPKVVVFFSDIQMSCFHGNLREEVNQDSIWKTLSMSVKKFTWIEWKPEKMGLYEEDRMKS